MSKKYEDIVKLCIEELSNHARLFDIEDMNAAGGIIITMDWSNFYSYISKYDDFVSIYTREYIRGTKTTAFYFVDGNTVFKTEISLQTGGN